MLLMIGSLTAVKAQIGRRDTTNMIVNPDALKGDSAKRGQEIYQGKKMQDDTASHKQKPKKKPTSTKEATKPK
jgi:hypothetical protein